MQEKIMTKVKSVDKKKKVQRLKIVLFPCFSSPSSSSADRSGEWQSGATRQGRQHRLGHPQGKNPRLTLLPSFLHLLHPPIPLYIPGIRISLLHHCSSLFHLYKHRQQQPAWIR